MVKHTQTIHRQEPTNCMSVFDNFVGLSLKGLNPLPFNTWCLLQGHTYLNKPVAKSRRWRVTWRIFFWKESSVRCHQTLYLRNNFSRNVMLIQRYSVFGLIKRAQRRQIFLYMCQVKISFCPRNYPWLELEGLRKHMVVFVNFVTSKTPHHAVARYCTSVYWYFQMILSYIP